MVPAGCRPDPAARRMFRRFEGLKAVVAGATGGVGKAIVQRLVREGVPVTALARDVREAVSSPDSLVRSRTK